MIYRAAILLLLPISLSGCSYVYEVLAVVQNGRLVFVVDPKSRKQPECVRHVEITSAKPMAVTPSPGDDAQQTSYGTFWSYTVTHEDACENHFPLQYGRAMKGKQQAEFGVVAAKSLLREVTYEVHTTTGATGYGSGKFIIRRDGKVENLSV